MNNCFNTRLDFVIFRYSFFTTVLLAIAQEIRIIEQMTIHAHRKGSESNDSLQQRFKKQVQRTKLMKTLRGRSHFKKKLTKREIRLKALKREEYRAANRKKQFYSNM